MSRDPASRPDVGNQDQDTAAHPPTQLGDQALPEAARAEHMEERESRRAEGGVQGLLPVTRPLLLFPLAPAGVRPKAGAGLG